MRRLGRSRSGRKLTSRDDDIVIEVPTRLRQAEVADSSDDRQSENRCAQLGHTGSLAEVWSDSSYALWSTGVDQSLATTLVSVDSR